MVNKNNFRKIGEVQREVKKTVFEKKKGVSIKIFYKKVCDVFRDAQSGEVVIE